MHSTGEIDGRREIIGLQYGEFTWLWFPCPMPTRPSSPGNSAWICKSASAIDGLTRTLCWRDTNVCPEWERPRMVDQFSALESMRHTMFTTAWSPVFLFSVSASDGQWKGNIPGSSSHSQCWVLKAMWSLWQKIPELYAQETKMFLMK